MSRTPRWNYPVAEWIQNYEAGFPTTAIAEDAGVKANGRALGILPVDG